MIYSVYQGEEDLFDGTAEEVAKCLKVKIETVKWKASPSGIKRAESCKNGLVIIKLEE